MINLNEVLKAAGLSLDDVVKTTVFLDDINDFAANQMQFMRKGSETINLPVPVWKWRHSPKEPFLK